MSLHAPSFVHDFQPGAIHFGRGSVADLGEILADREVENALVVCGRNVGANRAVMDPVEAGLGNRIAGVFDETTPAKEIETAYDGVKRMREVGADALVPVGAGSSLDTATVMSTLHGEFRSLDEIRAEVRETGNISVPGADALVPLFPVPTTFAGADLSVVAGISVPTDGGRTATSVLDEALMPTALFYDPDLFETTPTDVLAGSAFNGFDKATETIYSRFANPVTDATAVRSLRYLRTALPRLRESGDTAVMERAVVGIILAQQGVSVPGRYKLNVIHAFGHALRNQWGVQQGVAHAVMAPAVLEFIFERVDARRDVLAEGLVEADPDDPAAAIVEVVEAIREALDLPSQLGEIEGTDRDGIPDAAELAIEDPLMGLGPEGFDPSVQKIERLLREVW